MSFCDSYFVLSIISLLLIISIVILILYKNNIDNKHSKDSKDIKYDKYTVNKNEEHKKIIETFATLEKTTSDKIISNNSTINDLIYQISNISPDALYKTQGEIDRNMQTNIYKNINSSTNDIIDRTSNADIILSSNIQTLNDQITDLENIINSKYINNITNKKYSKIKSLNNGMDMTLTSTPNTNFIDPKTGTLTNGYMINMNDGCLSVGATDYDVYKCNDKNPKQIFRMQHIINEAEYSQNIDKALPFDTVDKTKINYPFTLIKSINNHNCLTNQNGNITLQPCYSYVAQRWLPV